MNEENKPNVQPENKTSINHSEINSQPNIVNNENSIKKTETNCPPEQITSCQRNSNISEEESDDSLTESDGSDDDNDQNDDDDDDEDDYSDFVDRIIEESPNKRFQKRNRRFPLPVPGVDDAFLALEPETGKEYVWNEIYLTNEEIETESQLLTVVKRLKKNYHPFLIRFYEIWIATSNKTSLLLAQTEQLLIPQTSPTLSISKSIVQSNHSETKRKTQRRSTVKQSTRIRKIVFITERLVEGSLKQYVCNSSKTTRAWKRYMGQILSVMRFLNNHGLNHGHLSNDNIFFQSSGALKVGTFALDEFLNRKCVTDVNLYRANTRYLAPEYREHSIIKISREGDVYALGVLALEVAAWEQSWEVLFSEIAPINSTDSDGNVINDSSKQPQTTTTSDNIGGLLSSSIAALGNLISASAENSTIFQSTATNLSKQQLIKNHELLLKLVEKVPDQQQKEFIKQCLQFNPSDRPSIRCLLNHPAMIEVPSLKLLAAKVIVHIVRPNIHRLYGSGTTREEKLKAEREMNQKFTEALFGLVDELTGHLENDTVICEIQYKKGNSVRQRTWKDYNFVDSAKKFLDDVRNGYYLLFGCKPPYQSAQAEADLESISIARTADLPIFSPLSVFKTPTAVNTTIINESRRGSASSDVTIKAFEGHQDSMVDINQEPTKTSSIVAGAGGGAACSTTVNATGTAVAANGSVGGSATGGGGGGGAGGGSSVTAGSVIIDPTRTINNEKENAKTTTTTTTASSIDEQLPIHADNVVDKLIYGNLTEQNATPNTNITDSQTPQSDETFKETRKIRKLRQNFHTDLDTNYDKESNSPVVVPPNLFQRQFSEPLRMIDHKIYVKSHSDISYSSAYYITPSHEILSSGQAFSPQVVCLPGRNSIPPIMHVTPNAVYSSNLITTAATPTAQESQIPSNTTILQRTTTPIGTTAAGTTADIIEEKLIVGIDGVIVGLSNEKKRTSSEDSDDSNWQLGQDEEDEFSPSYEFFQRTDMERPRTVEIHAKVGEEKLIEYRHCVIQDCEFRYVGCGRWQLTIVFYLLNEKMTEQIKRAMYSQYTVDEWHYADKITQSLLTSNVIHREHTQMFLNHIHLAAHNRPTRKFEVCQGAIGNEHKGRVDAYDLHKRLLALSNLLTCSPNHHQDCKENVNSLTKVPLNHTLSKDKEKSLIKSDCSDENKVPPPDECKIQQELNGNHSPPPSLAEATITAQTVITESQEAISMMQQQHQQHQLLQQQQQQLQQQQQHQLQQQLQQPQQAPIVYSPIAAPYVVGPYANYSQGVYPPDALRPQYFTLDYVQTTPHVEPTLHYEPLTVPQAAFFATPMSADANYSVHSGPYTTYDNATAAAAAAVVLNNYPSYFPHVSHHSSLPPHIPTTNSPIVVSSTSALPHHIAGITTPRVDSPLMTNFDGGPFLQQQYHQQQHQQQQQQQLQLQQQQQQEINAVATLPTSDVNAMAATISMSSANLNLDEMMQHLLSGHNQSPLSHLGYLAPNNPECVVCDHHDYLHNNSLAIYLSSHCYHCREYFAKKAGLTPLTFMNLHYEHNVPWPAYLAVRCGVPSSKRTLDEWIEYDCRIRRRQPCLCYPNKILPPCTEFSWSYSPPKNRLTTLSQKHKITVISPNLSHQTPISTSTVTTSSSSSSTSSLYNKIKLDNDMLLNDDFESTNTRSNTPTTTTSDSITPTSQSQSINDENIRENKRDKSPDDHRSSSKSPINQDLLENYNGRVMENVSGAIVDSILPAIDKDNDNGATLTNAINNQTNAPRTACGHNTLVRGVNSEWYTSNITTLLVCQDRHAAGGGQTRCPHGALLPIDSAYDSGNIANTYEAMCSHHDRVIDPATGGGQSKKKKKARSKKF